MESKLSPGLPPGCHDCRPPSSPTSFLTAMPSTRRRQVQDVAAPYVKRKRRIRTFVAARDFSTRNRLSAQDFFESFLRERRANGDLISKASDLLWKKELLEADAEKWHEVQERLAELQKINEDGENTGFLKLSQARDWNLGLDIAPVNAKVTASEMKRVQDDRRRASFLEYAALKRELVLLNMGIAVACSLYCLLFFSPKTALSYGIGAMGSLLYLQLLFCHADRVSSDNIAEVFLVRRPKRIGIRSIDVQDFFEKVFYGSGLALFSPRLLIPALLFGFWVVLHHSAKEFLDLQLAPLMLGFFAYKAAVLIQGYRDNKDLNVTFPEGDKDEL